MILESNPVFPSYSSVAEFATIIATLYDNQASDPSWNQRPICFFLSPLPSPPSPRFVLLSTLIMAASLIDFIPYFHGRDANNDGRQEGLAELIENLNFAIDSQVYADEN